MKLKQKEVEQQMASSSTTTTTFTTTLCSFENPILWIPILGQILILGACFVLGCGSVSILLTTTALLFSSLLLFTKSKQRMPEHNNQESRVLPQIEQELIKCIPPLPTSESKLVVQKEVEEEEKDGKSCPGRNSKDYYYLARPSASVSSESCLGRSSSSTDQDHDVEKYCGSDGSISDEDILIEIALPSGNYIGHDQKLEGHDKFNNLNKKRLPSAFSGSDSFKTQQYNSMELLAELNEEDNYIEIDVSMGSIKCPRIENEA